jgi:hypothetical protein
MINFKKAVRNINRSLNKKQPEKFNPRWIKNRCKVSYEFIVKNIKTEFDEPDWDLIVSKLERHNQKLWMKKIKRTKVETYKDCEELNVVLNCYQDKLYTFLGQIDSEDKIICDWISIKLVRLAQKGNTLAKSKVVNLLENLVDQWIEFDKTLHSWKGYNELKTEHIEACIRRFRYAGSFLGYLHRTLQYAGLGLVPLEKFSLDDFSPNTEKRIIETFIKK